MKYLPSVVLFVGAFMPDVSIALSVSAMFIGALLAFGALGKADIPLVDMRNVRWPNAK